MSKRKLSAYSSDEDTSVLSVDLEVDDEKIENIMQTFVERRNTYKQNMTEISKQKRFALHAMKTIRSKTKF